MLGFAEMNTDLFAEQVHCLSKNGFVYNINMCWDGQSDFWLVHNVPYCSGHCSCSVFIRYPHRMAHLCNAPEVI